MASKSQRRRAAKRKRAQQSARPLKAEDIPSLPRPLRLAVEGYERMATLVGDSANETEAREVLDEQLRSAVQRIFVRTERFDASYVTPSRASVWRKLAGVGVSEGTTRSQPERVTHDAAHAI